MNNLAAQSHVKVSFEAPEYTTDVVATGTVRLLEAIRRSGLQCRFYQASSSECLGIRRRRKARGRHFIRGVRTPAPNCSAHNITVNYRESYGLHACVRDFV